MLWKRKNRSNQIKILGTHEIIFHCRWNTNGHFTYEEAPNLNGAYGKTNYNASVILFVFFYYIGNSKGLCSIQSKSVETRPLIHSCRENIWFISFVMQFASLLLLWGCLTWWPWYLFHVLGPLVSLLHALIFGFPEGQEKAKKYYIDLCRAKVP